MSYELLKEIAPAAPAAEGTPTRSAVYRHALHQQTPTGQAATLFESFRQSVKLYADEPCLGRRETDREGNAKPFTFLTYKEVDSRVANFASALKAAGLRKGERVAIFGANCCEWMIAMQVCSLLRWRIQPQ
jgi:long-chain acyl-CoA synthetase